MAVFDAWGNIVGGFSSMDLSILKPKDPVPTPTRGERRHRVRHKLYSPIYASFSGPQSGMVLDLSELFDVHEDGFSVQTSESLEVNRPLNICLDLPETKKYIHASGHVVWSDGKGRGGIRFSTLSDESRRLLKEWLFVNVLIACAHRAARSEQRSQPSSQISTQATEVSGPLPVSDLTEVLSAVEAVRREALSTRNFDDMLQLVTERALSLTGAHGAALAFMTEGILICRGSAGDPAPPLGARVDSTHGLTGECVRKSRLVHCEDSETDPLVDRDLCRALGMRSILAVPVVSDFHVVGLVEVFSRRPRAFSRSQETVLLRIAEIVPKAMPDSLHRDRYAAVESASPVTVRDDLTKLKTARTSEPASDSEETLSGIGVRPLHLLLLILAVGFAALALGYVMAPTIEKHWLTKAASQPTVVAASERPPQPATTTPANTDSFERLHSLAESGDADAQYQLGHRYHKGEGVLQNDADAVRWFLRAADQGHVVSQAMLGYFYWSGQGVPRDLNKAYFWSVLARAGGDEASKYRADSMATSLTRSQRIAIQQQAESWLHDHNQGSEQSRK